MHNLSIRCVTFTGSFKTISRIKINTKKKDPKRLFVQKFLNWNIKASKNYYKLNANRITTTQQPAQTGKDAIRKEKRKSLV